MPFQIIVREVKPRADLTASVGGSQVNAEQIYEQTVDTLDLSKALAAVNFKPRVRKPRATSAPRT